MQEKYEQAIKETFEYLKECLVEQDKLNPLMSLQFLGVDKCYVIEKQMFLRGFVVKAVRTKYLLGEITVYPREYNLPIHIWKEK
jgi:hypothetical protein